MKRNRKNTMALLNALAEIDAQMVAQAKAATDKFATPAQADAAKSALETLNMQYAEISAQINGRAQRGY